MSRKREVKSNGGDRSVRFHPFESLAEALDGPRSAFFGVPPDGRFKRPESYYRTDTPYLGFNIANNQVLFHLRWGLPAGPCGQDASHAASRPGRRFASS